MSSPGSLRSQAPTVDPCTAGRSPCGADKPGPGELRNELPSAQTEAWSVAPSASQQQPMEVADWDALFDAVEARLRHAVGERLGVLPVTPPHSAELAASLVQAVVLDCVAALDQLHEALKQQRHGTTSR